MIISNLICLSLYTLNLLPSGYEYSEVVFEKFCKLEFLLVLIGIEQFGEIMKSVKFGCFLQRLSPICPQ